MFNAVRRMGYEFPQAIADLVDNSIDAKAQNILIALVRTKGLLSQLVVADDGKGIPPERIDDAMGFGKTGKITRPEALGKFGLGLKSASFSQADTLTLLSRSSPRKYSGRRWSAAGIGAGWLCDELEQKAVRTQLDASWPGVLLTTGTLVFWDDISELRVPMDQQDRVTDDIFASLRLHLGLHFHRFLENGLNIQLCVRRNDEQSDNEWQLRSTIKPLNPFGTETGCAGYPKKFKTKIDGVGPLELKTHILNRFAEKESYKLGGGRVAERQGFYFYRNDRLIQPGGWNGLRNDSEPHLSLARVEVDLPSVMDDAFSLTVSKADIDVPAGFHDAVRKATWKHLDFGDYMQAAQHTYRKPPPPPEQERVAVPSDGWPATLSTKMASILKEKNTVPVEVGISWGKVAAGRIFRLDRDDKIIVINERYRKQINGGKRGSKGDAATFKTLLFHLLSQHMLSERVSSKQQDEIDKIERTLAASLRATK